MCVCTVTWSCRCQFISKPHFACCIDLTEQTRETLINCYSLGGAKKSPIGKWKVWTYCKHHHTWQNVHHLFLICARKPLAQRRVKYNLQRILSNFWQMLLNIFGNNTQSISAVKLFPEVKCDYWKLTWNIELCLAVWCLQNDFFLLLFKT